jgi:hypothetical protein
MIIIFYLRVLCIRFVFAKRRIRANWRVSFVLSIFFAASLRYDIPWEKRFPD